MAAAGCYVSLHRAEGFGMTMAEALWLGTPVVATGYSGNLDFLDEDSAFLVPHELVPVPEGCDPYPAGTPWAEPDVGAAATLLRQVYEEPELAGTRTARGREHLASAYSPMVCGRRMRERLREIRRTR
jgi:glycosyltransferase involved in cell wall biosynthesis